MFYFQWTPMFTFHKTSLTMPGAFYQIRNIAGCAWAGNAGTVFPCHRLQRKPLVSNPAIHHGACTCRDTWRDAVAGKTFPVFPAHAQPAILRIWQEAHCGRYRPNGPLHGDKMSYKGCALVMFRVNRRNRTKNSDIRAPLTFAFLALPHAFLSINL